MYPDDLVTGSESAEAAPLTGSSSADRKSTVSGGDAAATRARRNQLQRMCSFHVGPVQFPHPVSGKWWVSNFLQNRFSSSFFMQANGPEVAEMPRVSTLAVARHWPTCRNKPSRLPRNLACRMESCDRDQSGQIQKTPPPFCHLPIKVKMSGPLQWLRTRLMKVLKEKPAFFCQKTELCCFKTKLNKSLKYLFLRYMALASWRLFLSTRRGKKFCFPSLQNPPGSMHYFLLCCCPRSKRD